MYLPADGFEVALGDAEQTRLASLVRRLELDKDPGLNKPGSALLDLALHEEASREIVLWAKLEPFLRLYAEAFSTLPRMPLESLEEGLEAAMDEPTHFLTQHLMKVHLKGEGPLGLGKLAEVRKIRNTSSWQKYKDYLADKVLPLMSDLQLWRVDVLRRPDTGGGTIAGYRISAGPALVAFHVHVYRPKREAQIREFFHRYLRQE